MKVNKEVVDVNVGLLEGVLSAPPKNAVGYNLTVDQHAGAFVFQWLVGEDDSDVGSGSSRGSRRRLKRVVNDADDDGEFYENDD